MAGFDKFLEYSKKWTDPKSQKDLEQFVNKFIRLKAQEVVARTKLRTPVDTGALRNSWYVFNYRKDGNDYKIDILNNKDYASHVEFGHAGVYVPSLGVTMHIGTKYTQGKFMLAKSMNEVELGMHDSFDTKFTKFLKDKGIGE